MDIHYLSRSSLQSHDANAVHVLNMTRAMANLGHKVTLMVAHAPAAKINTAASNVTIHELGWPQTLPSLRYPFRCLTASRRLGAPDLIYARHAPSALALAGQAIPLIYETHALQNSTLGRSLEWAVLHAPNLVRTVVVSEALRQDLLSRYPSLDPDSVLTAHDAANIPEEALPTTGSIRPPRHVPQVGYVGNLYPGKGGEFVLELARRLPELDFHIVGGRSADIERLKKPPLPENVTFHGHIDHSALPGIYASLDIGLVPLGTTVHDRSGQDISRWTSPLKLFEYMANRVSVIATDMPTIREVVSRESDCLLVPAEDGERWTEAVKRLAADSSLRKHLAEHAYQTIANHHTWLIRVQNVLRGIDSGGLAKTGG